MAPFMRKVRDGREPPGMERTLLRKLPLYGIGGTVVPALVALLNRWFPAAGTAQELAKRGEMSLKRHEVRPCFLK